MIKCPLRAPWIRPAFFLLACALLSAHAEMVVNKQGTPNAVKPGDTINYTVTLDNTTGATKTNVQLSDTLDANVALSGTVNVTPLALDDTYTCTGNVSISIPANAGVTLNDFMGLGSTASISAFDATSAGGGTVVLTTSGANMGAFTYNPPRGFTGNDTFKYTLTNTAGSNQGTVTIAVSNMIWFIDNTKVAAGDGRLSSPYNSLAGFAAVQLGSAPNAKAGDAIYIFQGSGNYTGGLTLLNNQVLLGQAVDCNAANLGFTPSGNGVALPLAAGTPTIVNATAAGNGITLGNGNKVVGLNLGNCAASAISGSGVGNLVVNTCAINTTGQALNLATGSANVTLTSTTSSGGTNNVSLSAMTGSIAFGTGAFSGATGTNFLSSGGTLTTTFSGPITRTSNGRAFDIQGATGGAMTFTGALSATANNGNTECVLLNNSGGTFSFTGGVVLSGSTSGTLFSAAGGCTVILTGANNTITATGTGTALSVTTLIGSGPMTFKSISASGSPNGIVLSNTGTGGFTVTGTGTTAASGGTINNTSGRGASFVSTGPVSLSNMTFTNAGNTNLVDPTTGAGGIAPGEDANANLNANAGIHLANITGVTLTNISITGGAQEGINGNNVTNFVLSNSTVSGVGNQVREDGLHFKDMLGTSSITNTTFTNNQAVQVHIENYTGATGTIVTLNTVSVSSTGLAAAPNGSHGFLLDAHNNANINFLLQNCSCNNLFSNSIDALNNGTGLMEITVTGTTFNNVGASAITLAQDNSGGVQYNIHDNGSAATPTFLRGTNNGASNSININQAGNATASAVLEGQVSTNFIGNNSSTTSSNTGGDGINVTSIAPGTTTAQINGNIVQGVGNNGINLIMGEDVAATHTMNLTVFSNTATVTNSPNGFDGIRVNSGTISTDKGILRLDMHNNTGSGITGANDIDVLQRQLTTVQLLNYAGANNDNAAVTTYIKTTKANTASHNAFFISNSVSSGGGGFVNTASVPVPTLPSPLLFATGGVEKRDELRTQGKTLDEPRPQGSESSHATSGTPENSSPVSHAIEAPSGFVTKTLTQSELNATVSAAIQRWIETGLNAEQLALLNEIKFEVKEMPGWYLGSASNGHVTISRDARRVTLSSTAAGYGWYVDNEPSEDSEFGDAKSATRRFADPRGMPAGRLDLLTTIMHEMGHQLGLVDVYQSTDRDSLMYGYLTLGERRLPAPDQARHATPRLIAPGAGFLFTPITIPSIPAGKIVTVTFSVTVNNPLSPPTTAQVTNQASVSANAGAFTANSNIVTTTILQPDMTITKTHVGSFTQGDTNKTYTLTVTNSGGAPTSGTVTVSDTLPAGLTPVSCTGTGWNAANIVGQAVTITRSDALGAGLSYPALTLTVNVAQTATNLTNTASVSGGNEVNTGNDTVNDPTTINPAPVTHFTVATPSTATAGTPFSVTVTALNAFNNPVTGYTGAVHFTKTDAGAGSAVPNNYTFTVADAGAHTFTNGVTLVTSGPQTVSVNDVAVPANVGTSGTITVSAAAATHLLVAGNNTTIAGAPYTVTVTAQDQFNNTATGYVGTVKFTKTDGSASSAVPANYTFVAGDSGTHTFTNGVTLNTAGSQTVTATDTVTASIAGSKTLTVNPGSAAAFVIVAPVSANAGAPFTITVSARDAFNNIATGYLGTVNFTKTDAGVGSAVPANYTFTSADSGAHTFTNGVTFVTAPTKAVTATDTVSSSITGTATVTVNPAATTKYMVVAPSGATPNVAFNFTVTAQDQFGNTTPAYGGTVHFTSTDPVAVLPANSTLTGGTGTFSATLKTVGNRTITATDTLSATITGTSGTVNVSAVTNFLVTAPPNATAGTPFNVSITARDANANTVTTYAGTVHFTSSDGAAILPANNTLTNGVGTFSVTLKTAGTQTVTATDAGNAAIAGTSGNIAVAAGPATHYTVTAPATASAGTPFSITLTALDQFNNVANGYLGKVNFTKSDNGAGSVLPANYTFVTGDNGTHSFAGGVTLVTAGNQTVTATDTVTASITGTTGTINVIAGNAAKYVLSAPATATAGIAFNFTVTAQDAFGNTATGYAGTAHFTSSDGSATLPSNSVLANGTGTFSATLKTSGTGTLTGTDTVTASITGTSGNIAVSAAAATHFTVTAPASATAGVAFSVTVTALDQFNNTAAGYTGTSKFTKSDGGAGSAVPANYTFVAADNGVHTFANGVTLVTAGNQTVTATDSVTASITGSSSNITVNAAAATKYAVSAPANATAGVPFKVARRRLDQFNNTATSHSGNVNFSSTDGAATLPAASTLNNGTGTFSATLRTSGNRTITATHANNAAVNGTSGAVNVNASSPTHYSVGGPGIVTAGVPFSVTVTALDQFNNTATSYTGTVHFTKVDPSAGSAEAADYSFTAGDNGAHTFTNGATLVTALPQSITATDTQTASINGTTGNITVNAAGATHFFVSAPASATAGNAFNFTVKALDQFNNTANAYNGSVHFTSSDTNGQSVLPGNNTLNNGLGTFSATLTQAGPQTIKATDTITASITGTSGIIGVTAAPGTTFVVSAPATATAGSAFNFTVTAKDAFGNTATGYTGTVGFSSSDTNAQTLLPNAHTLNKGDGIFSATLTHAGGQTLTATDTNSAAITGNSGTIAVSALAASHFVVSAPASVNQGAVFTATVTAKDKFENTDTSFSGLVHFTSSDANAVLPADSTLANGTGDVSAAIKRAGPASLTAALLIDNSINGSVTFTVDNIAPTVAIGGVPAQAETGVALSLTAQVTDPGLDVETYTYAWTVTRNGSAFATGTAVDFSFIPDVEGSYVCALTVTDSNGGPGSAMATIPVATSLQFLSAPSYAPNPASVNLVTTFTAAAQPANAALSWNFGDGSPLATGPVVQHIFVAVGDYTAIVTATNPANGATLTATLPVHVTDDTQLPGTVPTLQTKGTIRLSAKGDKLTVSSVLQFKVGQTAASLPLTITLNGLTRTFLLDAKGNAKTAEGKVSVRVPKAKAGKAPQAKLMLSLKGTLQAELSTGVAHDADGLPVKAALIIAPGGAGSDVFSNVSPLKFKKGSAKFGAGPGAGPH